MRLSVRSALAAGACAGLAGASLVGASPALAIVAANPCGTSGVYTPSTSGGTCAYSNPGTEDTFSVPAGVSSLDVMAVGAAGGPYRSFFVDRGGYGAAVANTALPVPAGTSQLYVDVGAVGLGASGTCPAPGVNDGGPFDGGNSGNVGNPLCDDPTGGGGGSSAVSTAPRSDDVLTGNPDTDSRLLVAAGGGGGGDGTSGGDGGDPNVVGAGSATCGGYPNGATPGGVGPTDGTNGGGVGCYGGGNGTASSGGTGALAGGFAGAGGGGGWFGGAGGGTAAAGFQGSGGAGSSYGGSTADGGAVSVAPAGSSVASSVTISWVNPPVVTAPSIDAQASAKTLNKATVKLTTPTAGDLLVAFVAANSSAAAPNTVTVSGGGLAWTRVGQENANLGDAEVWEARATGTLSAASISAAGAQSGYNVALDVIAFANAGGIGASGESTSAKGAPTGTITTTAPDSWVFAVGNDWLKSSARTAGTGQTIQYQSTDGVGDTYWVQSTTTPTATPGPVTINDTAPAKDPYNLVLVEVLGAASAPPAPAP